MSGVEFKPSDPVDFLVIGAGAAGGVMAKELSAAGYRVVVLEQGPYLREKGLLARRDQVHGPGGTHQRRQDAADSLSQE